MEEGNSLSLQLMEESSQEENGVEVSEANKEKKRAESSGLRMKEEDDYVKMDNLLEEGEEGVEFFSPHTGVGFRKLFKEKKIYVATTKLFQWKGSCAEKMLFLIAFPFKLIFFFTIPNPENPTTRFSILFSTTLTLAHIAWLTWLLTFCVQKVGCLFNIDEPIVGSTLLAVGTSLPDFFTSIFLAKMGKGDMAVSNAFGSNIFDVLFALGVVWLIGKFFQIEIAVSKGEIELQTSILFIGTKFNKFNVSIPHFSYLLALFLVFISLIANKWRLDKKIGSFFCSLYILFVIFTVLHEMRII